MAMRRSDMYLQDKIKRIVLWLVIFVPALFTGCSQKQDEGKIVIRYSTYEGSPEQIEFVNRLVKAFQHEYPHIKVKPEFRVTLPKILTQLAGGAGPDVFYIEDVQIPAFVAKGVVMDLNPFIEKDKFDMNDFFPHVLEVFRYGENFYCLPVHFSTEALFYNKTMFDGGGINYPNTSWTWDTYLEGAKRLTEDTNGDGRLDQFGTVRTANLFELIKANGGRLFNEDNTKCLLNTTESIEAVQSYVDLDLKYEITPKTRYGNEVGYNDLFVMGKVGMFSGWAYLLSEFSKIKNFEWDVAPVVYMKKRVSFMGVGGNVISSQTMHPQEAWEFVKFYSSEKGLSFLGESKNAVPALKSVALSPLFLNPPPEHISIFIDAVEYGSVWNPQLVEFEEFRVKIFNEEIDLILAGKHTVAEGLEKIVWQTDRLLSDR